MSSTSSPRDILAKKAEYLLPCVYHFYKDPPVIVRGQDAHLFDSEGKRYLDCFSGVTVMSAGHSNPDILAATRAQLNRLQHTTTIYLTEPMVQLAERLAEITPGALKRSFFCASGTEANEAAMLLASSVTDRHGFIALSDSLHGRTKWAMSATGMKMWRTDSQLLDNVQFAPHAFCQRCPLGKTFPECAYRCVDVVEECIQSVGPENLAALIAEPIQGNGGIVVPPECYWQRIRKLCDRYGLLLIFDEVQTAMNRTGRWFASEHWDVVPDIVTMAKALGNGMPIAVMIATDEIGGAYTKPGAATFGANPVSCATALAVIDFHEKAALGQRAHERGKQLKEGLQAVAIRSPFLNNARGKGLMIGVDVVDPSGEPDAERCDWLLESLKDDGFLIGKSGHNRNTLTFMPPLIVGEKDVASMVNAVCRNVETLTNSV